MTDNKKQEERINPASQAPSEPSRASMFNVLAGTALAFVTLGLTALITGRKNSGPAPK